MMPPDSPTGPAAIDLELYKEAIVRRESLDFIAVELTISSVKELIAAVEALRERIAKLELASSVTNARHGKALGDRAEAAEAERDQAVVRMMKFRDDAIKWQERTELTTGWADQWEAEKARVVELAGALDNLLCANDPEIGGRLYSPTLAAKEARTALAATRTQAMERARAVEDILKHLAKGHWCCRGCLLGCNECAPLQEALAKLDALDKKEKEDAQYPGIKGD